MVFYTNPWACIIFALILALHAASAFLKPIFSKLCVYVNICLHIALFVLLLFIGAEMLELAVLFMGSLAFYISVSYLSKKLCERLSDREDKS